MDPSAESPDLDYLLGAAAAAAPLPPPALADAAPSSAADAPNPKKRPLEEKKARDRKRVLRNRELARVSNERRKGRIKAMENELNETRKTVTTLEESIRCLEAENNELRNLLHGKPPAAQAPVSVSAPVPAPVPTPVSAAVAAVANPSHHLQHHHHHHPQPSPHTVASLTAQLPQQSHTTGNAQSPL